MSQFTRIEQGEILLRISHKLDKFKILQPGKLYNFRCPFCGDSKKNPNKRRGYIYEVVNKNTLRYKCHNCNISLSFFNFLKKIDEVVYNEVLFNEKEIVADNEQVEPEPEPEGTFWPKDILLETAKCVKNYSNHAVDSFIRTRKIPDRVLPLLYYTESLKNTIHTLQPDYNRKLPEDARILFPHWTNPKLDLFGNITSRALTQSQLRYYNFTINHQPKYRIWGLHRKDFLDKSNKIFVFEGIVDSLFFENSIAVCGSNLQFVSDIFPVEKLIFVFDNELHKNEQIRKNALNLSKIYPVVVWPKQMKKYGKDINEMIINGFTEGELFQIIVENAYSGMEAEVQIKLNQFY